MHGCQLCRNEWASTVVVIMMWHQNLKIHLKRWSKWPLKILKFHGYRTLQKWMSLASSSKGMVSEFQSTLAKMIVQISWLLNFAEINGPHQIWIMVWQRNFKICVKCWPKWLPKMSKFHGCQTLQKKMGLTSSSKCAVSEFLHSLYTMTKMDA